MNDATSGHCEICRGAIAHFFTARGYEHWRCADCGFVALNPMPAATDLSQLYEHASPAVDNRAPSFPKAASRARRARVRTLKLRRHFKGRDALDFGCGGGFVVDGMRRWGAARAVGLDIDGRAIAYANATYPDCEFFCASMADFLAGNETFDFVYASEVFEHIGDLDMLMRFVCGVTRPGGKIFVTTPDISHRAVPKEVTTWPLIDPPHHVQFFTRAALARLFERHGFAVVKRYPKPVSPGLQILAVRDNV